MDQAKRKRLEEAGWSVGTAEEFLELSQEEAALVEMKLALSKQLRNFRQGCRGDYSGCSGTVA